MRSALVVWACGVSLFLPRILMAAQVAGANGAELGAVKAKAAQGDVFAQFSLGVAYAEGQGVEKNSRMALEWYRKAANQGYVGALYNLGMMYGTGRDVERDYAQAVRWFRKAADQGLAAAQFNLGVMCQNGQGVGKDYADAARWYRKAADQGLAAAQFNLGLMYHKGQGVEKDYVEAYAYFNLAAKIIEDAAATREVLERLMAPQQVTEAQNRTKELAAKIEASETPRP
jgi:TPR repeat protein